MTTMHINTIKPAPGSKKSRTRVGRGIASGKGKTAGRGVKGQKSRKGGYHKVGFEGGQMPIQRRLPKFGFTSRKAKVTAEIRLSEVEKMAADVIDMASLRQAGLVSGAIKHAKIMLSGELTRKVTVKGIRVTKGAKAEIEKLGGTVEA